MPNSEINSRLLTHSVQIVDEMITMCQVRFPDGIINSLYDPQTMVSGPGERSVTIHVCRRQRDDTRRHEQILTGAETSFSNKENELQGVGSVLLSSC